MAQTSAPTEPMTLEAALSDQAQRTDGACHSSKRRKPAGNGMPIRKPTGAMSATVITIFHPMGSQTSAESKLRHHEMDEIKVVDFLIDRAEMARVETSQ